MGSSEVNNAFTTNASIMLFGAYADGINDDARAFRKALTALSQFKGKTLSALLLPPGRYLIPAGQTVVMPTGVTIKGSGDDSIVLLGAGATFQGPNGVDVVCENMRFESAVGGPVTAVTMIGPTGSLQLSHVTGGANVGMSIPNGIRFIQTDCNEIGQDVDVVTGGPYPAVTHLGDGLWVGTNQPRQIKGDIDPSAGAGYPAPQASIFQSTNGFVYIKTGPADTDWTVIGGAPTPDSDLMLFTVYVAKNGNDGTADGSVRRPFLTIQAAMDYAWNTYVVPVGPQPTPPFRRPCVFVNAGTYDDGPLVLPPQICVMGEGFNHTRIVGAWTLDNRWSNYVPPSLPSPPSVLVPNDFRSSFIGVGIFSPITFDFGAVFSNEGKIYAAGCRFAGVVTINEKTINPVSNSFNVQACEFIAPVVLGGIPAFIQNSTFLSSLTLNQLVGTGVDNVFASFGSSFTDIIINSTSGLAPAYDLAFSHSVQPAATLTLNGTFITIRGTIDSIPLQSNITLLGGATLNQITRINQPFFSGTTLQRPLAPYVGQEFFDTTLNQSIWWDGAAWITWPTSSGGGSELVWGNDDVGAAVDMRYMDPGRGGMATLVAGSRAFVVGRAGTLKNLAARHNTANGNGDDVVYVVVVNGALTGLVVTLATGAVGQALNLVATVPVVVGDRVELLASKSLPIGSGLLDSQVTVEFA